MIIKILGDWLFFDRDTNTTLSEIRCKMFLREEVMFELAWLKYLHKTNNVGIKFRLINLGEGGEDFEYEDFDIHKFNPENYNEVITNDSKNIV